MLYCLPLEKITRPPLLHSFTAAMIAGESSLAPDFTSQDFVLGDDGGIGIQGCFGPMRIPGAACANSLLFALFSVSARAKAPQTARNSAKWRAMVDFFLREKRWQLQKSLCFDFEKRQTRCHYQLDG
jgi:hypothetical protein